jgi:hypothetical protein
MDGEDWKERQLQDGLALAERMGGKVAPEDVYNDYVSASRFAKPDPRARRVHRHLPQAQRSGGHPQR